jgi:L-threonylcarbamoyladenylate synthase
MADKKHMVINDGLLDANVATLLQQGKIGVLPTDTLYGLVARAQDESAVAKLYSAKKRDSKPGTIIAASVQQLVDLGIKERYLKPISQYWPGPISVVIPVGFALPYLHLGKMTLAVRIPDDQSLNALLQKTGPLVTTSANMPGKEPATTIADAQTIFGNIVDFYVDGGNLSERQPSTIIRIVDDAVEVLRIGAVKIDESGKIH